MELMRYDPLGLLEPRTWLERIFEDAWLEPFATETTAKENFVPAVDIKETDLNYVVEAELPGIKKEDVHIDVKDGLLTIRGERKIENEEKKDDYTRIERSYGEFRRVFTLPDHVAEDKIEATYKDGVLTLTLPKTEKAKPKEIDVKIQ